MNFIMADVAERYKISKCVFTTMGMMFYMVQFKKRSGVISRFFGMRPMTVST